MARLYLDEDVTGFASRLRDAGHDVTTVPEGDGRSRSDAWQFHKASHEARTIVTWNREDFQYIHRLWTTLRTLGEVTLDHSGILTAQARKATLQPAEWIELVVQKLDLLENLQGRMWIWVHPKLDWVEDKIFPEQDTHHGRIPL